MTVRLWLLIGTIGLACGSAPSAAQTTQDLCALLSVPDGAGLIIRTAGQQRSKLEIRCNQPPATSARSAN